MAGIDAVLPGFRGRLILARERLVQRIVEEDDPERALPNPSWVRMAADLHTLILAVGDMIQDNQAEPGPQPLA